LTLPEGPECSVIELTRNAFASTVSRMFLQDGPPDLILSLEVRQAEVSRIAGLEVDLTTRVTVQTPAGEVIDVIDASGGAPALTAERGPLLAAARAATEYAALDFERSYAISTKIADYLVGKKIAPASEVAVHERSDKLATLALGIGFVQGSGDSDASFAPSLRAAWSYDWFFAQGMYTRYSSTFTAEGGIGDASLVTNDFGLEAGVVLRLPRNFEVRAGPGAHVLAGTADAGAIGAPSFSKIAPVLYASVTGSFIPFRGSPWIILGLEGRGYFSTTVELPELGRKLPIANTSVALTLGMELPWGASKTRSAP
jgi:hypothetical protein